MGSNMREVDVVGIRFEEPEYAPVLILHEKEGGRYVAIWIGASEAPRSVFSSRCAAESAADPRSGGNAPGDVLPPRWSRSRSSGCRRGRFSRSWFSAPRGLRPAVGCGRRGVAYPSPVLVSREVLDEVGISLVEQGEEEVEAFREFLDHVSPDDFLGGGGPAEEPGSGSS